MCANSMFKKILSNILGKKEPVTRLPDNDPAIIEAKKIAKPMIDDFLRLMDNPQEGMSDFEIKVAFELNHGYEDLWVNQISKIDQVYHAILDDEAREYDEKARGEGVSFMKKDVVDWGYTLGGVGYGYYTMKAQIPYMDEPKRSEMIVYYGWQNEFEVFEVEES